jgi:signal transduction histidine kinase
MTRGVGARVAGALGVVLTGVVVAASAAAALMAGRYSRRAVGGAERPLERHPWWPDGITNEVLAAFLVALVAIAVAAFLRRPRSGVAQALLAGASGNAASAVIWSVGITPTDLATTGPAWLLFLASGALTLVFWSSLLHVGLIFPSRLAAMGQSIAPAAVIYVAPQVALLGMALAVGAADPARATWLDDWARGHATIVSVLLSAGIVVIAARVSRLSTTRRRQVLPVAAATVGAAVAALALVDLPIALSGAPLASRSTAALAAIPVPVLLAVTLWRDHAFRLDRLRQGQLALLGAREDERRRLRRDLHDGLGPVLAAVGLKLDAARAHLGSDPARTEQLLSEARSDLDRAMGDARRLVRGLRPTALEAHGLAAAVKEAAEGLSPPGGDGPAITVDAPSLPRLAPDLELEAFRIAQEALTNVVRHSGARECSVRLALVGRDLHVEVRDDGAGLDGRDSGVGLQSISERAVLLGGEASFRRDDRGGTLVSVAFPVVDLPGPSGSA